MLDVRVYNNDHELRDDFVAFYHLTFPWTFTTLDVAA